MNKEDKYSLGYAISNSIQENKDKIAKLEKKVKSLTDKNKKLQHQLEEKQKVIDEAIKYIKDNLTIASILDGKTTYCLNSYSFEYEDLLKILERGKNGN